MKELQLVLSDDKIYRETGNRVPAEETVVIALDGRTRELDLTASNAKSLREQLRPWMEAGHVPGTPVPNPTEPKQGKVPTPELIVARAKYKEIRDWADAQGLRSEDGKRPIWRTSSGGYYYPEKLMRMYQAYLESKNKSRLPGGAGNAYDLVGEPGQEGYSLPR